MRLSEGLPGQSPGRIMALDVGERTIGIALTDPDRRIASPFNTIRRGSLAADLAALRSMIEQQEVTEIVVGLPRSLSGQLHYQAEQTQVFVAQLRAAVTPPIYLWDERFSTAEAGRALEAGGLRRSRRAAVIDQTAAAIVLQGYLAARAEPGR
jgi:putative holliday junction resolvase